MLTRIKTLRPTYAVIDLPSYSHNISIAQHLSGQGEVMAIVKANGYGHGADKLAEYIMRKNGIKNFGVATISEAVKLREVLGNDVNITVMGYIDKNFYPEVYANNIILTVLDYYIAEMYHRFLQEKGAKAKVVIKLETGMNRLGFDTYNFDIPGFMDKYDHFDINMFMTHLSSSDTDFEYTNLQMKRFDDFMLKNRLNYPTSVFNSSAVVNFRNKYTYTRPGIMTYGYVYADYEVDLRPVMRIYSKIVQVKHIKKGESVSYNRTFYAPKDMTIGAIPVGYADGYFRCFSNRGHVYIDGYCCPVIGNICMDIMMVDITAVPASRYSSEVELMGEHVTAEMWAEWAGSISYEMLCAISERIPRVYSTD